MITKRQVWQIGASLVIGLMLLAPASGRESFWLRGGPVYRAGMQVDVSGSSYVQELGLRAANEYYRIPPGAGRQDVYADRDYGDGFVYQDAGTGNPGSPDPDSTWFWGYQNSDQVRDGHLWFRADGGRSLRREAVETEPVSDDRNFDGYGVEIAAGRPLPLSLFNEPLQVVGAVRFFRNDSRTMRSRPYTETYVQSTFSLSDGYDVGSIDVPPAPYAGTYDGPFSSPPVIPSPLISNRPEQRSVTGTRSETWHAVNDVEIETESWAVELRLGPAVRLRPLESLIVFLQPAVTLNYLEVDLDRYETFTKVKADGAEETLNSWSDRATEGAWKLGAGIQAGLDLALRDQWSLQVAVGADWVDAMKTDIGPDRAKFDFSGWSVGLAVVRAFGEGGAVN